jgi:hypothetical protein
LWKWEEVQEVLWRKLYARRIDIFMTYVEPGAEDNSIGDWGEDTPLTEIDFQ